MSSSVYRDGLRQYLPEGCSEIISDWLIELKLKVVLWNHRKTKLGDFRASSDQPFASISINKSLNPYAFLITIVHEIAHAVVYEKYSRRVKPHGEEWKYEYKKRMLVFFEMRVFPLELEPIIAQHLINPKASATADIEMEKALKKHDTTQSDNLFLDDLVDGDRFVMRDGKVFIKDKKRRSRHLCHEVTSNRSFLISGLAEVKLLDSSNNLPQPKKINLADQKLIVENLKIGDKFKISNGMILIKGEKRRTRFICTEVKTKNQFLVPGNLEAELLEIM